MAYFPNAITFGDNFAVSNRSRLRVAESYPIWVSNFIYDASDMQWASEKSGGSSYAHLPNESAVQLTVGAGAADYIIRQTKRFFNVPSGRSCTCGVGFLFGAAVVNVTRRVGYFDDTNGTFIEQTGVGTISLVNRTSTSGAPSDARSATRANWNVDKMDGTGVSGVNLDFTLVQQMVIDWNWPIGRIRIGFRVSGQIYYAHTFSSSNNLTTPFQQTAFLPLRYEIRNTGVSAGATLKQLHSQISYEEANIMGGRTFATGSGVYPTTVNSVTTRIPICTIRPKTTFLTYKNRGNVVINNIDLHVATNSCYWELIYSGTLTGASWLDVDTNNSMCECDLKATAIAGGICIASGYMYATGGGQATKSATSFNIDLRYPMCLLDIAGSAGSGAQLTLVARALTVNSLVNGSLEWEEFR